MLDDPDREREVPELRFGLEDGHAHTLEEVGRRFWRYPRTHQGSRQGAAEPRHRAAAALGIFWNKSWKDTRHK
ncbi:MAG: hypothetical protein ACLUEQ_12135 [Cloacibacillus evryensis]